MSNMINDLPSLKANAKALDAELAAVFAKYGLKYGKRNARIGEGVLKYNIELSYGSPEEEAQREKSLYQMYSSLYGFPEDSFGAVYVDRDGTHYRIAGVQPNKPKNCLKMVRVKDGKTFQASSAFFLGAKRVTAVAPAAAA